jgi:hypothetical protein
MLRCGCGCCAKDGSIIMAAAAIMDIDGVSMVGGIGGVVVVKGIQFLE